MFREDGRMFAPFQFDIKMNPKNLSEEWNIYNFAIDFFRKILQHLSFSLVSS